MQPPKHLIVGGLGQLGRVLQKQLLQKGVSVSVLDLPSKIKSSKKTAAVVQPFSLGTDSTDRLCQLLTNVETVYNLATPDLQFGTVQEFETTNVQGTKQLLDACQQVGVPSLIYGSSVAITDSFASVRNGKESDALPLISDYQSYCDLTTRLAEEQVLAANNNNNNNNTLQSCALRFGGILSDPSDYFFRRSLFDCPGKLFTMSETKKIDVTSTTDASRALWLAHENMDRVAGRAVNVTQSKDDAYYADNTPPPTLTEINHHMGDLLGWKVQYVPPWMIQSTRMAMKFQHSMTQPLMVDPLGCPPHLFMDIFNHEKTFDNQLAKELLGYEPTMTWKETIQGIAEQYKRMYPSMVVAR